jgi:hypothetical protein
VESTVPLTVTVVPDEIVAEVIVPVIVFVPSDNENLPFTQRVTDVTVAGTLQPNFIVLADELVGYAETVRAVTATGLLNRYK